MCNAIDRLEVVEGKQRLAGGLGDVVSEQFHNGKHGQTAVLQFLGQLLDLLVTLKGTNTTKLREVTSAEVSGSLGCRHTENDTQRLINKGELSFLHGSCLKTAVSSHPTNRMSWTLWVCIPSRWEERLGSECGYVPAEEGDGAQGGDTVGHVREFQVIAWRDITRESNRFLHNIASYCQHGHATVLDLHSSPS